MSSNNLDTIDSKSNITELLCSNCDELESTNINQIPNCYVCKTFSIYEDCESCSKFLICNKCINNNINNEKPNLTKCDKCLNTFCDDCFEFGYIVKCGSCKINFCGRCIIHFKDNDECFPRPLQCNNGKSKKCSKFLCDECINNLPYIDNTEHTKDKDYVCNKCFKYHVKDLSKKRNE